MRIEHVAIWTKDIEKFKSFYEKYFEATSSELYHNPTKGFYSYFLSFPDGETRMEIMNQDNVAESDSITYGYAHIAMALGSEKSVDEMTERLSNDGYKHTNGPRTTGDGYYESVFEDPEGNVLELTV